MTSDYIDKITYRHSVIKYRDKEYLVKFLICSSDLYDEYLVVATDDFSNPYPYEVLDSDIQVPIDECEVIRSI